MGKNIHRSSIAAEQLAMLSACNAEQVGAITWRPVFFRLSMDAERHALTDLAKAESLQVFDSILAQLRDLIKTRHPTRKICAAQLESLTKDHLNGISADEYGVWVYYPWSRRVVHLLDEAEFAELRTNRNRNKITLEEQAVLATKRVGVVGLSAGQSVATTLALERSFGELRLADFDHVDLSNLNRIRAGVHSLGLSKAYVTAREIAEIDPYLKITVFAEGIKPDTTERFLLEGGKLDIVAEECDSFDIKILVRDFARRHRIAVVMGTSDRGMLDIERFDLEPERPIFHGLAGTLDPAALHDLTTEQKIPLVLRILGSETLSARLRASMIEIEQTICTWPQLGSAVTHGGAAVADVVRRIALGHLRDSGRFFLDLENLTPSRVVQTSPIASRPASIRGAPCTDPLVRDLVSQAILAPSGGNSQPWRWLCARDEVRLFLDTTRSSGLIDFEYGGSYAALGAAAENFILAAHAANRETSVELFPTENSPEHIATFHILLSHNACTEPHWRDELQAQIALRQTNRAIGTYCPLRACDQEALSDAVRSIPSADVQWLIESPKLTEIGELMGVADRLRVMHSRWHQEMFSEIRWTREEAESTHDGIDVETLSLSPSDYAGLDLCRHWPSLELVRQWGGGGNLEKISRKCIAAASAVALITMPLARPIDYFNAGRALQRMWLVATERNLSIHPMTTLPYFFARLIRASGAGFDERTIAELQGLRLVYERLFCLTSSTAEAFLFRISYAKNAVRHSLRRPIDGVLIAT